MKRWLKQGVIASISLLTLGLSSTQAAQSPLSPQSPWVSSAALKLQTEGYFSNHSSGQSIYPFLEADARIEKVWDNFEMSAQTQFLIMGLGDGSRSLVKPELFFEVPEVYIATVKSVEGTQITLGRKLESWSQMDDQWNLGVWQPRFKRDYLRPEQAGLLGLFVTVDRPSFRFVAFGSPVFIPDRGVPINNCDGMFCSSSPWFIPPSRKISIYGQDTPLRYSLELPSLGKVLLNPGAATMARFGDTYGPWFSAGYAYKPINQLLLGYGGKLSLDETIPYAPVTVYPRILYHHVVSSEAGYESERFSGRVSFMGEWPIHDDTPPSLTTQEVSRSFTVSPSLEWRFSDRRQAGRVYGSYIYQNGGEAPDQGPQANESGNIFEPRNSFQNAILLGGGSAFPFLGSWGEKLAGSSQILYDFGHDAFILSAEFQYRIKRSWMLNFGADLLTSYGADRSGGIANDFIGRYRARDRLYAGVTYVF